MLKMFLSLELFIHTVSGLDFSLIPLINTYDIAINTTASYTLPFNVEGVL